MKIERNPPKTEVQVKEKVVAYTVEVEVEPETFTVTFTRDELKTFIAVGQKIGGSPTVSPRGVFEKFNEQARIVEPGAFREVVSSSPQRFFTTQAVLYFKNGSIND